MAKYRSRRAQFGLPTDKELRVLEVLWNAPSGIGLSVDVIRQELKSQKRPYTTTLSMLQNMERKGYVRHERGEKAHYFYPIYTNAQAQAAIIAIVDSYEVWREAILSEEFLAQVSAKGLKRLSDLVKKMKENTK